MIHWPPRQVLGKQQDTFVKNVLIAEEEKEEVKVRVAAGWMSEDQMRDSGMKE